MCPRCAWPALDSALKAKKWHELYNVILDSTAACSCSCCVVSVWQQQHTVRGRVCQASVRTGVVRQWAVLCVGCLHRAAYLCVGVQLLELVCDCQGREDVPTCATSCKEVPPSPARGISLAGLTAVCDASKSAVLHRCRVLSRQRRVHASGSARLPLLPRLRPATEVVGPQAARP